MIFSSLSQAYSGWQRWRLCGGGWLARVCAFGLLVVASAHGANLIRNGSFEVPGGWYPYGPGAGGRATFSTDESVANHYVATNGSFSHGTRSIYFLSRLNSDPFPLLGGGTYTVRFDARVSSAHTIYAQIFPTWNIVSTTSGDFNANSATNTWKSFTNTFVAQTNGMHIFRMWDQSSGPVWVDAVQVETGTVASAFSPASPIEVGMDTTDQANVLFSGDAKNLRFTFWSEMPGTTNMTCPYQIVNLWNTNVVSGVITSNALPAGRSTNNLALPTLNGWLRAVCYITNLNNTRDEVTVSVLPYTAQSGRNQDGLLGIHPNYSPYILADVRRMGFSHARIFSPTTEGRWTNSMWPNPDTPGPLFSGAWGMDFVLSNFISSGGLIPWIVLTPQDHDWHPALTNEVKQVNIAFFTNYAGQFAHRYRTGQTYTNLLYEIINEPQLPPRPTIALYDDPDQRAIGIIPEGLTNYGSIFDQTSAMFKAIDPNISLIAFGGLSQADQGTSYWARISAKTNAQFLGFHFYPHSAGADDGNATEDESSFTTANVMNWRKEFGTTTNKSFNTETYTGSVGGFHTKPFAYPFWYDFFGVWQGNQAWIQTLDNSQVVECDRLTYMFCRSIGAGFSHVNIQHAMGIEESMLSAPHPTIYENNSSIKPMAAAILIASYALKTPGFGRVYITNATINDPILAISIEAYGHTNSLGNVASVWCPDRGGRRMGLTNGSFAVYDTMWNVVQTNATNIYLSRSVQYLVSGSLSYLQFTQTLANCAVFTNADTKAPGLTVDYSPIGTVSHSGGASNLFKATAIDETSMLYGNTNFSNPGVVFRWTLNEGSTFSPWSVTNFFIHSFASEDMYRVGFQARDAAGNTSATAYTPYFGTLEVLPLPSVNLNVGTLNVGTITIISP